MRHALLALVFATAAFAQAPDDCSLVFNGSARRDVKLRAPSLATTYTAFGTASAPKDLTAWFAAACSWDAKLPSTIPAGTAMPGLEDHVVTLQAYLVAVKYELDDDRDLHIELAATTDWSASKHLIIKVPPGDPFCSARQQAWSLVKADAGTSTPPNTYILQHPILVTVTGFVFYDAAHPVPNGCTDNADRGVRQNGSPSMVQGIWELHPVITITPAVRSTTSTSTTSTTSTTGTTGTIGTTTTPPPPVEKTPPGAVWYVRITKLLDPKTQRLEVIRDRVDDPSVTPVPLSVADDVRLTPAFRRLQANSIGYVRVNNGTVTRIEQLPTDPALRTRIMLMTSAVLLFALVFWRRLLQGADGPYSKSKFQLAVWFGVLILAYVSTNLLRAHVGDVSLFGWVNIPAHLALLSGISLFTFGAAKGIRVGHEKVQARIAAGPPPAPVKKPSRFPRDLFTDDQGNPDLGDVQMLVFTLLAVVVYVVQIWSWQATMPIYSPITLPDVDTTILAAMGLGQGAYLMKKQVSQ